MSKETILCSMFFGVFVVLSMQSMVDKKARIVLYEYSKLFFAGYLGYLLK